MKERKIRVVKDSILGIGLINKSTDKVFPLPDDELDDILEEIKNLRRL